MYACIPEIGGGFFEGVCAPSNATAYLNDPPLPLDSGIDSGRRALAAISVRAYAGPGKAPFENPLQGTSVYKPAGGHYNSGKCFIVIFGCSPSVEGVGSLGGAWRIPPSELFYSEAMGLHESICRTASNLA
jgi:hypothetical protein